MINLKSLTKKDIGRWVIYDDGIGNVERGRLKSWNDHFIFVVYKCNHDWDNFTDYTGNATFPDDISFDEAQIKFI